MMNLNHFVEIFVFEYFLLFYQHNLRETFDQYTKDSLKWFTNVYKVCSFCKREILNMFFSCFLFSLFWVWQKLCVSNSFWYSGSLRVLCLRPVSSGEVQLHRRGRSRDGCCPRSLPHHRLHHRDSHRSESPSDGLHWQSVSLANNSWRRMCLAS